MVERRISRRKFLRNSAVIGTGVAIIGMGSLTSLVLYEGSNKTSQRSPALVTIPYIQKNFRRLEAEDKVMVLKARSVQGVAVGVDRYPIIDVNRMNFHVNDDQGNIIGCRSSSTFRSLGYYQNIRSLLERKRSSDYLIIVGKVGIEGGDTKQAYMETSQIGIKDNRTGEIKFHSISDFSKKVDISPELEMKVEDFREEVVDDIPFFR